AEHRQYVATVAWARGLERAHHLYLRGEIVGAERPVQLQLGIVQHQVPHHDYRIGRVTNRDVPLTSVLAGEQGMETDYPRSPHPGQRVTGHVAEQVRPDGLRCVPQPVEGEPLATREIGEPSEYTTEQALEIPSDVPAL